MCCFLAYNFESIIVFILKTAVQVGIAIFLLDYGIGTYKKQKIYDKSAAKVNDQIEKAQEVITPSSGISDVVFKLVEAKDDNEVLEKIFNLSNGRKELYLSSFLNNVINLSEEMKRRNENDLLISRVKNENLMNILFKISLERFGLFFRFDDFFKKLMSRTTNSPELVASSFRV
jgi:hypothetical protein